MTYDEGHIHLPVMRCGAVFASSEEVEFPTIRVEYGVPVYLTASQRVAREIRLRCYREASVGARVWRRRG
jgi:hypothetical protein